MSILLGVNIDHVATLRQARLTSYPSPVQAGLMVEAAGADSITVHLREDRRHIQDADVITLKEKLNIRLNFEMALTDEMVDFATKLRPANACIVPEKRQELTTEGGLNLVVADAKMADKIKRMQDADIDVSAFIDADLSQIDAAHYLGIKTIELHTGRYADATNLAQQAKELAFLQTGADYAKSKGIVVNAGHGLHYDNTQNLIKAIPDLNELNIGHSIIARAVFVGLPAAVEQMLRILKTN